MTRRWFTGRVAALAAVALAMAACSSDRPKPTALETLSPKINVAQAWQARLDNVRFALQPVSRGGQFMLAGSDGAIVALRADNGQEVWRSTAGAPLTAGVGSDGRFTAVATTRNEVVAFEAGPAGARELWRQRVPARVITAPFVAGERVFVMSVDRVVHAFDALDGRRLWTLARPGEALTLAQGGVLTNYRNLLVAGQGARLVAIDPLRGNVMWEAPLATPRGTNEVERLSDLIGPAVRVGDRICARSFQSAAGCADAARGVALWSRGSGGAQALAASADIVVGADASDRVTAWRANNGDVLWSHERFLHRGLSGAVMFGPHVVFGDRDGQVHFLSASDGSTLQRLPTDGSPVVGTPTVLDGMLMVVTQKGGVFAFRMG
jgi:outer membrane protein assembly factor BamB